MAEISKGLQVENVLREEMERLLPEGTEDAARAIVEGVRVIEEMIASQEPMDLAI